MRRKRQKVKKEAKRGVKKEAKKEAKKAKKRKSTSLMSLTSRRDRLQSKGYLL